MVILYDLTGCMLWLFCTIWLILCYGYFVRFDLFYAMVILYDLIGFMLWLFCKIWLILCYGYFDWFYAMVILYDLTGFMLWLFCTFWLVLCYGSFVSSVLCALLLHLSYKLRRESARALIIDTVGRDWWMRGTRQQHHPALAVGGTWSAVCGIAQITQRCFPVTVERVGSGGRERGIGRELELENFNTQG